MRVLTWPASTQANGNPYVDLLYDAMRAQGHEVDPLSSEGLRGRPHVIHIHWPELLVRSDSPRSLVVDAVRLLPQLALARERGTALVWTAHNLQPHERSHPRLMAAYFAGFMALVNLVIGLTARSREPLVTRHPLLARKPFVVVPHGHYRDAYAAVGGDRAAARAALGIDPARRTLLCLGYVRPYKNVPALVRAFVDASPAEAQLVIVGEVASPELRAEVEAARAGDARVHLELESVANDEVAAWYAAADVAVLAHDTASALNSGSALLSLSLDRPVVLPDGPSARELRDAVGAEWVVPVQGEIGDFVEAALAAPSPPAPRPDLAHLDWPRLAERTVAAYERSLARRRLRTLRSSRGPGR